MYEVVRCNVYRRDDLYDHRDTITKAANCLRNAALFRIRQAWSMHGKTPDKFNDDEKDLYAEMEKAAPLMMREFKMPNTGKDPFLSYTFWDEYRKVTGDPDHMREGSPVRGLRTC